MWDWEELKGEYGLTDGDYREWHDGPVFRRIEAQMDRTIRRTKKVLAVTTGIAIVYVLVIVWVVIR